MAQHNELGKRGEAIALEHLRAKGYYIIKVNARHEKSEVDILAQHEGFLVVVEVKSRTSDYYGRPEDFITKKKINMLCNFANAYVDKHGCPLEVRFDVVSVLFRGSMEKYEIEHLVDAFYPFM